MLEKLDCYICNRNDFGNGAMVALIVKIGSNTKNIKDRGLSYFVEYMNAEVMGNPFFKSCSHTGLEETIYLFSTNSENDQFMTQCFNTIGRIMSGDCLYDTDMEKVRENISKGFSIADIHKHCAIKRLFGFSAGEIPAGDKLRFEDITRFHRKWYQAKNAAIIVLCSEKVHKVKQIINNLPPAPLSPSPVISNEKLFTDVCNHKTIYFASKANRRSEPLAEYIKSSLCLHIVIDVIDIIACNYFGKIGCNVLHKHNSMEAITKDWFLIQFHFTLYNEIDNMHVSRFLSELTLSESVFKKAYQNAETNIIEMSRKKPDIYAIMCEYIQFHLYNEPIMKKEIELEYLAKSMKEIDYEMVYGYFEMVKGELVM